MMGDEEKDKIAFTLVGRLRKQEISGHEIALIA